MEDSRMDCCDYFEKNDLFQKAEDFKPYEDPDYWDPGEDVLEVHPVNPYFGIHAFKIRPLCRM